MAAPSNTGSRAALGYRWLARQLCRCGNSFLMWPDLIFSLFSDSVTWCLFFILEWIIVAICAIANYLIPPTSKQVADSRKYINCFTHSKGELYYSEYHRTVVLQEMKRQIILQNEALKFQWKTLCTLFLSNSELQVMFVFPLIYA